MDLKLNEMVMMKNDWHNSEFRVRARKKIFE